jgi:hypothetical protein
LAVAVEWRQLTKWEYQGNVTGRGQGRLRLESSEQVDGVAAGEHARRASFAPANADGERLERNDPMQNRDRIAAIRFCPGDAQRLMEEREISPAEDSLSYLAARGAQQRNPRLLQLDYAMNQAAVRLEEIAARTPVRGPGFRREREFRALDLKAGWDLRLARGAGELVTVHLPRSPARDQHVKS